MTAGAQGASINRAWWWALLALGVLGASVMGTSGAHNPTLTAQALGWRTAEHLVRNWKTIAS